MLPLFKHILNAGLSGIYDRVAELIMSISCHQAGTPRKEYLRQLDDHIGVGQFESVSKWCDQYQKLCSDIGVV